jgi:formylglycine-generating enzyme required for sulfatase activity
MPTLFISYSRKNVVAVTKITDRLRHDFHYDIRIDTRDFQMGEDWRKDARALIDKADALLLMLTPDSCDSPPVKDEIDYAREKGVRVLPLLIEPCTSEQLDKLAMRDPTHVSFMGDEGAAWKNLIEKLGRLGLRVLKRDERMLDADFAARHRDYLRSLFARFGKVPLKMLLDDAPREFVRLLDVYVPLKLNISFNIEVRDGEYHDWWLRKQDDQAIANSNIARPALHQDTPKSIDGFAPQGDALPAWEEVLRTAWQEFKASQEKDGGTKLEDKTYFWNRIESETAPALMPHLVITGDPGSGKSILLQHLALCLAGDLLHEGEEARADLNRLTFWSLPPYVPVFIELRDLVEKAFPNPADKVTINKLYSYLEEHQLAEYAIREHLRELRDMMRDGEVMFFLDGLDEVPDAETKERRQQIKALIGLLREQHRECRILVTSRPYAYVAEDWQLHDFGHVSLAPLDLDRLEELALKLFTVVLGADKAESEAESFEARMEADVPDELRRSPLFFTLLAALWLNNADQPAAERLPKGGKSALYRACVQMLVHRTTQKDANGTTLLQEIGLDEAKLRRLLEALAYHVHQQGEGKTAFFSYGDIVNIAEDLQLTTGDVKYKELSNALGQRIGITYAPGTRQYRFAHRSFQEHLAAAYLCDPARYPSQICAHLSDRHGDWRNVMELLPGEAAAQGRDLWTLLENLLPQDFPTPTHKEDRVWMHVYHAARLLTEHLPANDVRAAGWQDRLRALLVALIQQGALPPIDRAEMGRILSRLGDPRPGVGVRFSPSPSGTPRLGEGRGEGIPDILWSDPIMPATFSLGDDDNSDNPRRQSETTIPYRISRYLVTDAQFQAFVDAPDFNHDDWWVGMPEEEEQEDLGTKYRIRDIAAQRYPYANHPRENVTWYQAVAFTRWLTHHARKAGIIAKTDTITLPTEAQWERAARWDEAKQHARRYPYDDAFDASKGNTDETGIGMTSAVGLFPDGESPYYILDMSGNVWQWCLNKYGNPEQTAVDDSGDTRGLRGGSFILNQYAAAASYRDLNLPLIGGYGFGFRVVCASL